MHFIQVSLKIHFFCITFMSGKCWECCWKNSSIQPALPENRSFPASIQEQSKSLDFYFINENPYQKTLRGVLGDTSKLCMGSGQPAVGITFPSAQRIWTNIFVPLPKKQQPPCEPAKTEGWGRKPSPRVLVQGLTAAGLSCSACPWGSHPCHLWALPEQEKYNSLLCLESDFN